MRSGVGPGQRRRSSARARGCQASLHCRLAMHHPASTGTVGIVVCRPLVRREAPPCINDRNTYRRRPLALPPRVTARGWAPVLTLWVAVVAPRLGLRPRDRVDAGPGRGGNWCASKATSRPQVLRRQASRSAAACPYKSVTDVFPPACVDKLVGSVRRTSPVWLQSQPERRTRADPKLHGLCIPRTATLIRARDAAAPGQLRWQTTAGS